MIGHTNFQSNLFSNKRAHGCIISVPCSSNINCHTCKGNSNTKKSILHQCDPSNLTHHSVWQLFNSKSSDLKRLTYKSITVYEIPIQAGNTENDIFWQEKVSRKYLILCLESDYQWDQSRYSIYKKRLYEWGMAKEAECWSIMQSQSKLFYTAHCTPNWNDWRHSTILSIWKHVKICMVSYLCHKCSNEIGTFLYIRWGKDHSVFKAKHNFVQWYPTQ